MSASPYYAFHSGRSEESNRNGYFSSNKAFLRVQEACGELNIMEDKLDHVLENAVSEISREDYRCTPDLYLLTGYAHTHGAAFPPNMSPKTRNFMGAIKEILADETMDLPATAERLKETTLYQKSAGPERYEQAQADLSATGLEEIQNHYTGQQRGVGRFLTAIGITTNNVLRATTLVALMTTLNGRDRLTGPIMAHRLQHFLFFAERIY